ncbi:hypothetical protein MKW92_002701 [Papaver armeniacum]|nr:hypothetical protein MKW92_002701 [Papaver armeniacum]
MDHNNDDKDEHDHELAIPSFRFHPTEEELIEFCLHCKVEGKRFKIELTTFLDLYQHDPCKLPAVAAIGEKESFFSVPKDRKYRNGDRQNHISHNHFWIVLVGYWC